MKPSSRPSKLVAAVTASAGIYGSCPTCHLSALALGSNYLRPVGHMAPGCESCGARGKRGQTPKRCAPVDFLEAPRNRFLSPLKLV